ncbi:hypothetical protein GCM10009584_03930 [Ornithinimicrobium humiphilum]|uniref:Uncharacterized protein n=1 Tax=Ornithinimicrobium humiphilum TaxID=125288 RepID=A0A543K7V5_9MICO|nr:hypothetical protein [Ornithinimicrobium humiphilum]TQM91124.1 hypothetical protein FB476_2850 [Ornithinimicrobium humiphilum]
MTSTALPVTAVAPRPRPTARTGTALWIFRVVSLVQATGMVLMPYLIGSFLQGHYPALKMHATVGGLLMLLTMLELAAAALLRWPGRLPLWPALAVLGLLVLLPTQLGLGYLREVALHVPLGVLLVAGSVALAGWAWTPGRARRSTLPASPARPEVRA